jgi:RimJ/RimL family protein N-acetyltransferase
VLKSKRYDSIMFQIHSDRLTITTWTNNNIEVAQRLWGDPKVMEFIDIRGALNREQVEEKLRQEIERQNKYGVQYWKVILKTGEPIGCCGLRPYDLENRVYEIGFHIMSAHWNKGYATEAAKTVINHAFNTMKLPKLFAGHNPKNSTSKAMLIKLGFIFIGTQFYEPTGLQHPSYELKNNTRAWRAIR